MASGVFVPGKELAMQEIVLTDNLDEAAWLRYFRKTKAQRRSLLAAWYICGTLGLLGLLGLLIFIFGKTRDARGVSLLVCLLCAVLWGSVSPWKTILATRRCCKQYAALAAMTEEQKRCLAEWIGKGRCHAV
jgi:hypothetical protein